LRRAGLHAEGHPLLSRALVVLDETAHPGDLAFALVTAAFSLRGVDSIERTMSHAERDLARRSLALCSRFGCERASTWGVIAGLALVRARQGNAVRAVELLGRVQTHPSTEHSTRTRRIAPFLEELRAQLPAAEFDAALARGAELALIAAID
jgi:hypothetical protein